MKLSPHTTAFEAPAPAVEPVWSEAAPIPPPKPRSRLKRFLRHPFTWWVLAPTLLAIAYFYLYASPQYVSEARFVVRSRADAPQLSLGNMLSAAVGGGGGGAAGDAYSVRDFLTSHDAVRRTNERLDLTRIWGREEADLIARLWNDDPERLTK
ncbi:MAG TPA: capsule biosynthesis protein, partial [Roseomonas sp.]|nr:capsule biosynthesis protein [Roseomonas sp.]